LQATQTLRVYANLPQLYSGNVKRGSKIDLTFAEHPGKTFQGTLVRNADAIDPVSRTLLVEIDIDNRGGELLPGSLAQVHFKTPAAGSTFIVPAAALIFRRRACVSESSLTATSRTWFQSSSARTMGPPYRSLAGSLPATK